MAFISLRIASFRNLCDAEYDIKGKDIFLIGENGQGKTNFLEALYYASYGSSFRGVQDKELIRIGEKDCSVSARFGTSFINEVTLIYKDGKKSITVDNKKVEDRKELLSVAPCIVFCHEDMEFVSGAPERRRWFFDQTQSLCDPFYLETIRNYRKVLKTRNILLKKINGFISQEDVSLLDSLDTQLVRYGYELIKNRQDAVITFSRIFKPLYREISGIDDVTIRYTPSWDWDNNDTLIAELLKRRETDISMGTTFSGPHRDRYVFIRKGCEFSGKASTGQRRLLALLLRIAQASIFSEKTGKNSVFLLDDVLLELDGEKRRKFLSLMPQYDQAFFTFLPEEPYEHYREKDTIIYNVKEGMLEKS